MPARPDPFILEDKLFQYRFPEPLWDSIENFLTSLTKMPLWVNRELSQGLWRKAEPGVLADHFRVGKDSAKSTNSAFRHQSDENDSRLKDNRIGLLT
jgi:hypothetical protein